MKKIGSQTIEFSKPPQIIASTSIVGNREKEGPLAEYFEEAISDGYNQQNTWEQAQIKLGEKAIENILKKVGLAPNKIDCLLGGDLLNQTIASNFAVQGFPASYLGLFGACATIIEGLALGSIMIEGQAATHVLPFTTSHYQATERQFRTPNEYGDKYPAYKQKTVTGAGSFIVSAQAGGAKITKTTLGKVVDFGVNDPQNLGAAMAPAAADTILQHLKDTGRNSNDYDLIVTGDLGEVGKSLTNKLLSDEGCELGDNLADCGVMIYDLEQQKVGAGGSGCACSAVVLAARLLPQLMHDDQFNRILVVGTGALLSPLSNLQGETIPSIAHAVTIEATGEITKGIGRKKSREQFASKIEKQS